MLASRSPPLPSYPTVPPPDPPTAEARPALAAFRTLLRRAARVTVYDGRIFLGTLVGTDKALNILLVSTQEFRPGPATPSMEEGRFVGQVMIPWRRVVKVEVEGRTEEEEYT
jgi:small nuclear ribonucleoprotein (snRNP)-like protein